MIDDELGLCGVLERLSTNELEGMKLGVEMAAVKSRDGAFVKFAIQQELFRRNSGREVLGMETGKKG